MGLAVVVDAVVAGTAVLEAPAVGTQLGSEERLKQTIAMQYSGCLTRPAITWMEPHKPDVVGLAGVVGAGVSAPTRPPNSPPGAAVVAGTAVLDTTAASTQPGFQRLHQTNII